MCKERAEYERYEIWSQDRGILAPENLNAMWWGFPISQHYLEQRWMTTPGKSKSQIVLKETVNGWAKAIVRKSCKLRNIEDLEIKEALPWYEQWLHNLYMYVPARTDDKPKSKVRVQLLLKVIKREFGSLNIQKIRHNFNQRGFSQRQRIVIALVQTYIPGCRLGEVSTQGFVHVLHLVINHYYTHSCASIMTKMTRGVDI